MRNTLICTVGTSLLGNLGRSTDESIQKAFKEDNLNQLALLLLKKDNWARICGAEINSITSICKGKVLDDYQRLVFLVSDTDDGKKIGKLLKLYYENSNNTIKFRDVDIRVLEGLKDSDVKAFKQQGLKNLVKEISTEVRKFSSEAIAINATGGYKAQISFAGMIGQALEIPVYYLFEKFSEVIELPPQPIALDLVFWLDNYLLFDLLETELNIKKSEIKDNLNNEYIQSLIEEETIDEEIYVTLSAMGFLFHERSRLQFAKQETTLLSLIPQNNTPSEKKTIKLRDDHGQYILQDFSEKIRRSPYVEKIINSLPFNPQQKNPIKAIKADGIVEFVLTWTDAGLGICIQTTGRDLKQTKTIAIHLAEKYSK